MKILSKFFFLTLLTVSLFACKNDDDNPGITPDPEPDGDIVLEGTITKDSTLDATRKYILRNFVYVKAPAKLTIPAGTIIKGEKASKGSLIIERGAQIIAQGTQTAPIIFTSDQAAGSRDRGDWGGLIVLGNAPENQPGSPVIEGGVDRPFGGTNAADNSGILSYVRIEFAGIAFTPNNEINGLTLGGVGSGTTIDHVQVSFSNDDSFEWFGGNVNAKYLVAFKGTDDDFDTDFGFVGKVQYAVSLRDPNVWDAAADGTSNGFESDNDATGTESTPETAPVFSNVSIFLPTPPSGLPVGHKYGRSLHLRRNTATSVFNSVFAGPYPVGLRIENALTYANAVAGQLQMANIVFAGQAKGWEGRTDVTDEQVAAFCTDAARNISPVATVESLLLNANNFNLTTPSFLPQAGSPLLTGGTFGDPKLADAFFEKNGTFKGAFGTTDWTQGWTNFNPQTTAY